MISIPRKIPTNDPKVKEKIQQKSTVCDSDRNMAIHILHETGIMDRLQGRVGSQNAAIDMFMNDFDGLVEKLLESPQSA